MTATLTFTRTQPFVMRFDPMPLPMTDEELFEFCQLNAEWRIERTATGELIVMPPAGGERGNRNAGLTALLWLWAETDGTGLVFDSSTGLPCPMARSAPRTPPGSTALAGKRWCQSSAAPSRPCAPTSSWSCARRPTRGRPCRQR
jgi:hypothetical protein